MNRQAGDSGHRWPCIGTAGFDGFLVRFADRLSEPANRAALAFRAAVERAAREQTGWTAVEETASSLVSTWLRFDPRGATHGEMRALIARLLASRNWFDAALPAGRRLWRVPTVYGTELAPQLAEAAAMAGLSPAGAVASVSGSRLRVQAIGFAPGQPYLGPLPPAWDIPRQTRLTDRIPVGALAVAIRQLVLYSAATPAGWRHIGQTAFRPFRPDSTQPFALRPGDEVVFEPVTAETLAAAGEDGGAVSRIMA